MRKGGGFLLSCDEIRERQNPKKISGRHVDCMTKSVRAARAGRGPHRPGDGHAPAQPGDGGGAERPITGVTNGHQRRFRFLHHKCTPAGCQTVVGAQRRPPDHGANRPAPRQGCQRAVRRLTPEIVPRANGRLASLQDAGCLASVFRRSSRCFDLRLPSATPPASRQIRGFRGPY